MPLSPPMTHTLSVRCQNCGSPLQVNDSIRFVTCGYCHSELQVVRDASTVHTEVLRNIERNTAAIVNQLKVIELQNEIDRLDREWDAWKEQNLSRNQDGTMTEPVSLTSSTTTLSVIGVFVLFTWIIMLVSGAPFVALLLPAAFGLAFFVVANGHDKYARSFLRSKARFDTERSNLLTALEQARKGSR